MLMLDLKLEESIALIIDGRLDGGLKISGAHNSKGKAFGGLWMRINVKSQGIL